MFLASYTILLIPYANNCLLWKASHFAQWLKQLVLKCIVLYLLTWVYLKAMQMYHLHLQEVYGA